MKNAKRLAGLLANLAFYAEMSLIAQASFVFLEPRIKREKPPPAALFFLNEARHIQFTTRL